MDAAENELLEPAVIAPSVRPSIEGSEQAGLMMGEDVSHDLATFLHRIEESGHISDDDDYGAVNDISDSSDDEPDVEQVTERVLMKNKGAHPTTNHLRWYEHEEKIQGKLGENESFFDQHVWDDESESSSLSSEIDYHTAWDGIPDTPVEPSTPMSLPSPRRVHFGAQSSRGHLESTRTSPDRSDAVRLPKDPVMVGSEVVLDNSDAESGYESGSHLSAYLPLTMLTSMRLQLRLKLLMKKNPQYLRKSLSRLHIFYIIHRQLLSSQVCQPVHVVLPHLRRDSKCLECLRAIALVVLN